MHWLPTLLVASSSKDTESEHTAYLQDRTIYFGFAADPSSGYSSDVDVYREWLTFPLMVDAGNCCFSLEILIKSASVVTIRIVKTPPVSWIECPVRSLFPSSDYLIVSTIPFGGRAQRHAVEMRKHETTGLVNMVRSIKADPTGSELKKILRSRARRVVVNQAVVSDERYNALDIEDTRTIESFLSTVRKF